MAKRIGHGYSLMTALVAMATLLAACTDDIVTNYYDSASGALAARRIQKADVNSRADIASSNFPVDTRYKLWGYKDNTTNPGTTDFTSYIFDNSSSVGVVGRENSSNYVDLDPADAKKIKRNIHIYGFTDCTSTPVSDVNPDNFIVELQENGTYSDYMRGYLHYNPTDSEFEQASYAVIPFEHIMSQVMIKVVQYGEVSYSYNEDGTIDLITEEPAYLDLKVKEIRLANAYKSGDYCIKTKEWDHSAYVDEKKTPRILWSTDTPLDVPVEIAEYKEDAKPVTTNLVMPQEPAASDKMKLEVVICGDDATKFNNTQNIAHEEDGDIVITLDLDNNDTTTDNTLKFLSNYSYTLVVTFQSNEVRVVTIAPLIYPFFQGEGDTTKDYEDQAFEQPSVFDNIQWCDRYTGADRGYPLTIADFQESTGFYYQKNRTIPFYPTKYINAKYIDNKYWPIAEADMVKGTCWFHPYNGDFNAGWQWKGGKIYYRYGGEWQDVSPEDMFDFPKVRPVVSFWLPPEMEITGLKQYPGDNYEDTDWILSQRDAYMPGVLGRISVFWNSPEEGVYVKEGPNRYCRTVQEFIADDGESIRTYWSYLRTGSGEGGANPETGKYGWFPVNKRLNWAMQIDKDTVSQFRTWDANTTNLPCPPGWRLPTKQDFLSVFPGSAAAGNITFLDFLSFGSDVSTIAPLRNDEATILKDPDNPDKDLLEIYVKTPFNVVTEDATLTPRLNPPLRTLSAGGYRQLDPLGETVVLDGKTKEKRQLLSREEMGDPLPGYESEYVISKRTFSSYEYTNYNISSKGISLDKYTSYNSKVAGMIAKPSRFLNTYEYLFRNGNDATWGVIYGIKKVGTNEAYRLRYRILKIENSSNLDAYVLVIEQYKASSTDRLKYELKDINDKQYFLNYSWDYPDATLYFPITGMVGDAPCINGQTEQDKWVCAVFNYGTETILLSNEYENDEQNQAVLRIKIGGTNTQNQFIFQGMARLGLGGQVRPVRTFRTGGD